MGKKGGKSKGKPVVMTQQEFFSQQETAVPSNQQNDYAKLFQQRPQQPQQQPGNDWSALFATQAPRVLEGEPSQSKPEAVKEEAKKPIKEEKPQIIEEPKPKPVEAKPVKKEEEKIKATVPHKAKREEPVNLPEAFDKKKFEEHRKQYKLQQEMQRKVQGQDAHIKQMPIKPPAPPQMPNPGAFTPFIYQPQMQQQQVPAFQNFVPTPPFQHKAMRVVKPEEPVPQSYDDVFKQLEQKTKEEQIKKEAQQKKKNQQQAQFKAAQQHLQFQGTSNYDDDDYYDDNEYDQEDFDGGMNQMQQLLLNPNSLTSMLQGFAQNPMLSSQLDPNQLGMLMDPNQVNTLANLMTGFSAQAMFGANSQQNNPVHQFMQNQQNFGSQGVSAHQQYHQPDYDPEVENIDDIINQPFTRNQSKSGAAKMALAKISQSELELMEDDQAIIDLYLSDPARFTVCEYYKQGYCKFGDDCAYMHPPDLALDDEGNDIYEMDEECCICLEKVLDNGRQFGVLENCDHTFCLKCIRGWRSTYDKRTTKNHFRTCPICRRNSYLVIPSSYLVKSGPEKTSLVEEYKEVLKEIPCRLFNKGKGECPFMNSCNYSHRLPDGTVYEYPWKDVKLNEMGEWEDDHELTLAERFGNFTI